MSRRLDTRRDYRHFPAAYTDLLLLFQQTGTLTIGQMTEREARTTRRDLYRFFAFLRNAPSDDDHASTLAKITTDLVLHVEPAGAGWGRPDNWCLTATRNPVARGLAALLEGT